MIQHRSVYVIFIVILFIDQIGGKGHTPTRGDIDFDYRIADTVKAMYHGPFSKLREKIPAHFPDSIGAHYVRMSETSICAHVGGAGFNEQGLAKRQECYDDKIAILDAILAARCGQYDSLGGVVMHVRLGDAFCAKTEYVLDSLQPPTAHEVFEVARHHLDVSQPFTVIYSTHGGCENETSSFLRELHMRMSPLIKEAKSPIVFEEGIGWRDADKHLCSMVNSSKFIQGSGGFSYLAERVRTRRGLDTMQDLVRYPIVWLQADLELQHQMNKKAKLATQRSSLS